MASAGSGSSRPSPRRRRRGLPSIRRPRWRSATDLKLYPGAPAGGGGTAGAPFFRKEHGPTRTYTDQHGQQIRLSLQSVKVRVGPCLSVLFLQPHPRPPYQLAEAPRGLPVDLREVEAGEPTLLDLQPAAHQDVADHRPRGAERHEVVRIGLRRGPQLGAVAGKDGEVGVLAGLDRSHLVLKAQGAGPFAGGEAEGVEAGEGVRAVLDLLEERRQPDLREVVELIAAR